MKRKIIICLTLLFGIFLFGALVTSLHFLESTKVFTHIIKLHEIENLRHHLIEKILRVQTDLYAFQSPGEQDLGQIIEHVSNLEDDARQCTSCHHDPEITLKLENLQHQILDFQNALSFFITVSANEQRVETLKKEAAIHGNILLQEAEKLAFEASEHVRVMTQEALNREKGTKFTLIAVFGALCLLGTLVAIHLTRSVTDPIEDLVNLTRKIAAGELGCVSHKKHRTEFGELTEHLNTMSLSLREGYVKLRKEIAERIQTEAALRKSEERFSLAVTAANDGIWDWDLNTGSIFFSPRWKEMLGYREEETFNHPDQWFDLIHPDDLADFRIRLKAHIEGHTSQFENQHRIKHKDGTYLWVLNRGLAARNESGTAWRMAGSQADITEKKTAEERLFYSAFHDALTSLPNRLLLLDRMEQLLHHVKRHPDHLSALLFLDLDRFKIINDSLGHIAGDWLLTGVSQRLKNIVRPSDTVARLGGDEFAILLEGIHSLEEAVQVARRIGDELPVPFLIQGQEVFTSASIGIALTSELYQRPEQMLRDADLAMYKAKANGKARFEIFDESMHALTLEKMQLEISLRRALVEQEFRLLYQPVLCLKQQRITGIEALLRWRHPKLGLIGPDRFLPLAEETGLISQIGHWVIREACATASLWKQKFPTRPPLWLSLNVSGQELTAQLPEYLSEIFGKTGMEPQLLCLEISESAILKSQAPARDLLDRIKSLGVCIQIDDFGTGYSSLSFLHQLPIDALKIDGAFISGIHHKQDSREIVETIINLAHNMGMDIIAEGVETEEELSLLRQLGADAVQGRHICGPLEAGEMEPYILKNAEPAGMEKEEQ